MALMSKPIEEYLVDRLNALNPTAPLAFTTSNLQFRCDLLTDSNGLTLLPTVGILGRGYVGAMRCSFNKLDLTQMYPQRVSVVVQDNGGVWDIIPDLNRVTGLQFTKNDLLNTPLPAQQNRQATDFTIRTATGSLGFKGSIQVTVIRRTVQFYDRLYIYAAPNALGESVSIPNGYRSLSMVFWNVDFTPDRQTLSVNPTTNQWQQPSDVQNLLQGYGLNGFLATGYTVRDYATDDYPAANQRFDRVIVADGVTTTNYAGRLMLHYNDQ